MQVPMIEATAITMPILPADSPKASATRLTFVEASPGPSRLTTSAAVISARKAFSRSASIKPITVTIPMARIARGEIVI